MANYDASIIAWLKVQADKQQAQAAGVATGDAAAQGFKKGFLDRNPDLVKLLGEASAKSGGMNFFSAGGNKVTYPLETFTQKFGANLKQMRQGMSELKPALADFERGLMKGFSGLSFSGLSSKTDPYDLPNRKGYRFGMFNSKFIGPSGFSGGFGAQLPFGPTANPLLTSGQIKNLSFGALPLLRPGSLWGDFFAGRQIFSAFASKSASGSGSLASSLGFSGGSASAAGATGITLGALIAVGLALKGLEKIVSETARTYDRARLQYANALMSGGLPLGSSIKRSNLASVLGVSENDVYKFGAAVAQISPKIKYANEVLAKNALNLTSVAWEFKALGVNLDALFSSLGNIAAPALRKFAGGLSNIVNVIDKFVNNHPTLVGAAINGAAWAVGVGNFIGATGALGKDGGAAGAPRGYPNQLPAGNLEHMGLVIGNTGINSFAKTTAINTGKMVTLLQMIIKPGATNALPPGQPQA